GAVGQIVNIGSNFEISIGDTAKLIAEQMDREVEFTLDERRLRPADSEVDRLWADNTRARELAGWTPGYGGRDGFGRGLRETIASAAPKTNLGLQGGNLQTTIVATVRGLLGEAGQPMALHEPEFAGREWDYVKECLDTGWVSSVGSYVDRIE
ncbi:hypothetical protein KXV85_003938, partial [Aspergillus fumigatus]